MKGICMLNGNAKRELAKACAAGLLPNGLAGVEIDHNTGCLWEKGYACNCAAWIRVNGKRLRIPASVPAVPPPAIDAEQVDLFPWRKEPVSV